MICDPFCLTKPWQCWHFYWEGLINNLIKLIFWGKKKIRYAASWKYSQGLISPNQCSLPSTSAALCVNELALRWDHGQLWQKMVSGERQLQDNHLQQSINIPPKCQPEASTSGFVLLLQPFCRFPWLQNWTIHERRKLMLDDSAKSWIMSLWVRVERKQRLRQIKCEFQLV